MARASPKRRDRGESDRLLVDLKPLPDRRLLWRAAERLARMHDETLHPSDSMVSLCFRSLVNYITDDNFVGLQNFLENKRVQVDDRDENGTTALAIAAAKGKLAFVRELINHGADVNAEDADNWTALLCAAKEGYLDICLELLEHGANIEHRDMGGWTPLMWASYKGRTAVANLLLERGAEVNAHGNFHISSLLWACGRGHVEIVRSLIHHGAKVNVGDKYGTSALVWASRKGHTEIVDSLLKAGANVDAAGMYSWTPLLVATLGNHVDVVNLLLEHKPNVNALDKDGCTALMIASKEGYHEIVQSLLNVGAYINIQDRAGDTNLIHAVKGGHRSVVEALLKKYADIDITGKDRKTAVYWAVEKGNVAMVKLLLTANPDLEIATKDGDTPLLRAVRIRNAEIVQLLLDKKSKVTAADKKGDTALHIAMRARSKGIVEVLLRNPKNSQLLYRPNRSGETPYNIDMNHPKTILGQIFGARRLNTNEDNENLLGYDLYSSALADILSEPSLSMPITVGLYAKWGSGKSFLLNKLREEMQNFARQWTDPVFQFSLLLFVVILHLAIILGTIIGLACLSYIIGLTVGGAVIIIAYTFLLLTWNSSRRYDWYWPYNFNVALTKKLNTLKLILQVMFCHPPGSNCNDGLTANPIRFYFTDQTRVSSTTGGENSVVQMLGSLYDSVENDYGSMATRLYRAFHPKPIKSSSTWRLRRLCCLPYAVVFELCIFCVLCAVCVSTIYFVDIQHSYQNSTEPILEPTTAHVSLITIGLVLGVSIVANLYTGGQVLQAIIFSQRRHLQRAISKLDTLKSEGFLQALRSEVTLMTEMVKCLDSFTNQQTRLVIIVDGLDSCEQDKVLLVLDAVHMLFSDTTSPFIVILAIDPHIISKAVEVNSRRLFSESNIGGHDYLRNMVHLPFYLQNSGLRKVKVAQSTSQHHRKSTTNWNENEESVNHAVASVSNRRLSTESGLSSTEKLKPPSRKGSRKLKLSESIASSLGSNLNRVGGAHDLTKMLLTDDYFSDVNPRSMRRLMNVVYVTGRLLKAFQIDFNWYHLASWINITEQWPFRTSWLILYYDMYEDTLEDNTSLKTVYDKVRPQIPISKEIEPLLELDRDERKFDIFLTFHRSTLLVSDLKIFLPFTINLDPYIKKVIKEEQQNMDDGSLLLTQPFHPTSPPSMQPMMAGTPQQWNTGSSPWSSNKTAMLRRQRALVRTPSLQGSNVIFPQNSIMGWPSPWMDPTPVVKPVIYPSISAVTSWPQEIMENKLSAMSVEEVCALLSKLEDISPTQIQNYITVLRENNISGRVLLHCDLEELKRVLKMSFGDWELFRMLIVSLRENELAIITQQEELNAKNVRFSVPLRQSSLQGQDRKGVSNKNGSGSDKEKTRSESRSTSKQSVMEKQVTLEEQMICGALQTLNEEACEDVLDETDEHGIELSNAVVLPSNPELLKGSTAIAEPITTSTVGEADVVLLQASPLQQPHWQPVTISIGSFDESEPCSSIASSTTGTPVAQRRRHASTSDSKPPLPPNKYDTSSGSLHNIHLSGASRSMQGLNKPTKRQRPSSLLVLGDDQTVGLNSLTPPTTPKHVAFRSNSAEDGNTNNSKQSGSSVSLIASITSLRSKRSNSSLNENSNPASGSVLVTPASSLEKLNRIKDKIMRTVGASALSNSGSTDDNMKSELVASIESNGDIDSDDESTPLVSESSTPATNVSANSPSGHFLNHGFFGAGGSDSSSGNSPSSVKTTPISPDFSLQQVPMKNEETKTDTQQTNKSTNECYNDNCSPTVISIHQTPGECLSSIEKGVTNRFTIGHLERQNAVDNSAQSSNNSSIEKREGWDNPETTV